VYFFPHSISNLKNNKSSFILFPLIVILSFLIFSCSSSKRFTTENNINSLAETNFIRILINEKPDDLKLKVNSQILLSDEKKPLAKINSGNIIIFRQVDGKIELSILDKIFLADTLYISSGDADSIIKLDENKLRGRIKIFLVNSQIKVVNQIGLEEYVRGVMTKEMPLGQGNENYEALKAFSICVRTYALLKIFEDKSYFDIYPDTRDQI
jgi:stage II sporulation protein D